MKSDLRNFHWTLVGQDIYKALEYVPADQREAWDRFLTCLLGELRLVDFVAETITFRNDSVEASVRVRWMGHPMNSLVVRELLWRERWVFDPDKQQWFFMPTGDRIEGLPERCHPPQVEKQEADTAK